MAVKREKALEELEVWASTNIPQEDLSKIWRIFEKSPFNRIADEAKRRYGVTQQTGLDYADVVVLRLSAKKA